MHQPNTSETFTPEQTAAIIAFQDALPVLEAIAKNAGNDIITSVNTLADLDKKLTDAYQSLIPDAQIAVNEYKDACSESYLNAFLACFDAALAELEAAVAEDASISEDPAVMIINAAKSKADAATQVLSELSNYNSEWFSEVQLLRYAQATAKYEQFVIAADAQIAKIVENALRIALENVDNVQAAINDAGREVQGACAPTFSSRVVNFFCESAKNRNVQFGTAAVVGAAVGFGLSYVSAITTLVAGLLSVAAATIPPVAALVIVGALVGVLLALAIEFTYDKYQANNTPATK